MISRNTIRHTFEDEVAEGSTPNLSVTLRDLNGVAVPASVLTGLRLTLFNDKTGAIVNGRDHVSVLNTGIGAITEGGVLTLALNANDTPLLDSSKATELRVALIEWDWTVSGVPKSGKCEMAFVVRNLQKVSS